MQQEFDTINTYQYNSLNGWFDGFCPSNGIADQLNRQARGVWAQKKQWDKKYNDLKNGKQANQWQALKNEVRKLAQEIKTEQQKLKQEEEIAKALGLGAWCNGAVSKRKKAEQSLRSAEAALGKIKGAFKVLEQQQTLGIKEANKVIEENRKKIASLKQMVKAVKIKIEKYKQERDNKRKITEAKNLTDANNLKNENLKGKLKENAPLLIGIALLAGVYYTSSKKKNNSKTTSKKVKTKRSQPKSVTI